VRSWKTTFHPVLAMVKSSVPSTFLEESCADLFNETYDFASPFDGDGHGMSASYLSAL
jgi:hypothetical protein